MKTKAPLKVLEAFKLVHGFEPFYQLDGDGKNAFLLAMCAKKPDPNLVYFLSYAAPKSTKSPMPNGLMPAIYAAERGMPDMIVKQLVLADMPIHFGTQSGGRISAVVLRTHSYSWWHLATRYPKYATVMDDILSNLANIHEVVALAQEADPEGNGCLYESACGDVKTVFKNNLVFGERYEVIAMYRALVRDGLLKACALDWGDRIAWEEMADKESGPHNVGEDGYIGVTQEGNNTEVIYYSKPQREVLLHCCLVGSDNYQDLLDEMESRKKFNFSHADTQRLYNVHTLDAKKVGCVGEMICLSFERPLLSLADVSTVNHYLVHSMV